MPRNRQIVVDTDEEIVAFEYNIASKFVRVVVGFGVTMPDGFRLSEGQNCEVYILQEASFDRLMEAKGPKPAGQFRKEDLWEHVDLCRQAMLQEREEILAKSKTK